MIDQQEPHTEPSGLNKEVFQPRDRVQVRAGDNTCLGTVIGVASRNVIDMYIVALDEPLECGWTAINMHSTEMLLAE